MAPLITLYILGGCVAVAAILFIVMIVLSVARPPRQLSIDSPPLERMIRALTPLPIAGFEQASPKPARTLPPPPPVPAHVQARAAMAAPPIVPAQPIVPSPPIVPAPPIVRAPPTAAAPRMAAPASTAPASTAPAIGAPFSAPRFNRAPANRPLYPVKPSRMLRRFVLGLLLTTTLAAGAVVAYPALLDPACDDYVWFGDEAAQAVRDQARAAHDTIVDFIATL
jgi:hypothetical protein